MSDEEYIKNNIEDIRKRVGTAAVKSGRKPEDIRIIAVTKTVEEERIIKAINAGISDLGENRVQELLKKYDNINEPCNWHLIGHLQSNKVKYIIDKVTMIHSVDSIELLEEIHKKAEKAGRVIDILVQVNVAGEETKSGIAPEEVRQFLKEAAVYRNVKVKGLMTIAPFSEDPESVRPVFRELHKIFIDINKENIDNIDMAFLSMGMSNDFEVAIEEGANIVRIGTAIFGRRNYIA
ncbi:MAG: YggS family pyridoxal phosphate-dependent enzyme [Bacillota bacterium]|nr:YggS family pyridoxal phosphate-dependent enzyme [Bacillota bacterium]